MYLVVRSLKINNEKIVSAKIPRQLHSPSWQKIQQANNRVLFIIFCQDYEIQEHDILKIGRVKFAVKEIGYANHPMDNDLNNKEEKGHSANSVFSNNKDEEFEEFITVPGTFHDMSHQDPEHKCRFCWATDASEENPLLGTCRCAGSMGQIHYSCLAGWL